MKNVNARKQIDERSEAFPSQAYDMSKSGVYALTLSSNKATRKSAYNAYNYVIYQLPPGLFKYTESRSTKGKYHIHGLWWPKYHFDYRSLMDSLKTESDCQFDIHIHYDRMKDKAQYDSTMYYITHQPNSTNDLKSSDSHDSRNNLYFQPIPPSCIPEVYVVTFEKHLKIPGLYTLNI